MYFVYKWNLYLIYQELDTIYLYGCTTGWVIKSRSLCMTGKQSTIELHLWKRLSLSVSPCLSLSLFLTKCPSGTWHVQFPQPVTKVSMIWLSLDNFSCCSLQQACHFIVFLCLCVVCHLENFFVLKTTAWALHPHFEGGRHSKHLLIYSYHTLNIDASLNTDQKYGPPLLWSHFLSLLSSLCPQSTGYLIVYSLKSVNQSISPSSSAAPCSPISASGFWVFEWNWGLWG